jgi:hypothetical protein
MNTRKYTIYRKKLSTIPSDPKIVSPQGYPRKKKNTDRTSTAHRWLYNHLPASERQSKQYGSPTGIYLLNAF